MNRVLLPTTVLLALAACGFDESGDPAADVPAPAPSTSTTPVVERRSENEPLDVRYPSEWDTAVEVPFTPSAAEHEVAQPLIVDPDPEPQVADDPSDPVIDFDEPIQLDATVLFTSGTAVISPDADATLQQIALAAHEQLATGQRLRVDGHVDERGAPEFNEWLGDARANAVASRLIRHVPALEGRIDTFGHGEDELLHPDCPGDCPKNRVVLISAT